MKESEMLMEQELYDVNGGRREAPYTYYTAQEGDTVWSVAQKYKTTSETILRLNCWENDHVLQAGDSVLVPLS